MAQLLLLRPSCEGEASSVRTSPSSAAADCRCGERKATSSTWPSTVSFSPLCPWLSRRLPACLPACKRQLTTQPMQSRLFSYLRLLEAWEIGASHTHDPWQPLFFSLTEITSRLYSNLYSTVYIHTPLWCTGIVVHPLCILIYIYIYWDTHSLTE